VTAAADVFAWGSVVAYAGTGRLPFGSGPAPALAYRVVHGAANLDGLEPSLGELVQASMAKDPAARPGAHHLLLRLLGNVTDPQAAVTEVLQRTWAETEQLTSVPRPPADPVDLALALEERGDTAAAQAAYRQACEAGAPGQAAKAARNLGLLLKREGDVAGAREAFWRAVHAGDPDQSPKAARNLGYLLAEEGDVDGARAAYEWVMGSAHPEEAPAAARNLGVLAEQQGDPQAAAALYRWAIASGHPEEAPAAAVNLVALLVEQGDAEGARAAARAADDHPAYAFMVASNLRLLDRPGR
jgi:Flp pilus assembly protein TadD